MIGSLCPRRSLKVEEEFLHYPHERRTPIDAQIPIHFIEYSITLEPMTRILRIEAQSFTDEEQLSALFEYDQFERQDRSFEIS